MTQRCRNKANNFDTRVKNGTYPAEGIKQVINAVQSGSVECLKWAADIGSGTRFFSWPKYNKFCGCLYAAIFSYGAQGRTQAVEQLDLKEFQKCWTSNIPITSTKFKTKMKYGKQIVTIPEGIAKQMMTAYNDRVRPAARACLLQGGIMIPSSKYIRFVVYLSTHFLLLFVLSHHVDEKLFLSKSGKHLRLSRYLLNFFIKSANLKLTVTTLRKMVETEIKLGRLNQVITSNESVEVNMTLGHSRRTSDSTYVLNTTEMR